MIEENAEDPKCLRIVVLDTSIIIDGKATAMVEKGDFTEGARIIVPVAALDELKKKGPGSTRDLASMGAIGEAALSFGCLGLAAAGQVEAGIPCVIGGAMTSGALRYLGSN